MADLITLADLKARMGIDPTDTREDIQIAATITAASAIIESYTGRSFGAPIVTETRGFDFPDTGYVDIDDCTAITSVSLSVPHTTDIVLTTDDWRAMPTHRYDSPVYFYLALPAAIHSAFGSPEMGFTRNLDVFVAEGRFAFTPLTVNVTATWGWPAIPEDVKQAVYWTIDQWVTQKDDEGLTSESIDTFSRSWGRSSQAPAASSALPNKARDILARYQRILV